MHSSQQPRGSSQPAAQLTSPPLLRRRRRPLPCQHLGIVCRPGSLGVLLAVAAAAVARCDSVLVLFVARMHLLEHLAVLDALRRQRGEHTHDSMSL
jgi:hypothetical protein